MNSSASGKWWSIDGATALIVLLGTLVLACAAALLTVDANTHRAPWMNNDTALVMFIAHEMDRGARLYVDWMDPNPPSIFFVLLAAVRASHLGLPAALAYDFIVLLVAIGGLAVLTSSLRGGSRSALLLAAAAYVLFVLKPGALTRDFGQREHLFALMFIPELFALSSARDRWWRIPWCAVLAFLAMMKPQFLIMLLVAEIAAPRASRPRRVEAGAFAVGACAPLALLWLHSAEAVHSLFTEVLALHLSGGYGTLTGRFGAMLARGPLLVMSLAAAAGAALVALAAARPPLRALALRAGVGLALAMGAVVHQQKYFPYHFIPLFGLAVVAGAWAAGELMLGRRIAAIAPVLAALMLALGMAVFCADVARNDDPIAVRLGRSVEGSPQLLVVSVYSHGLCTAFEEAPRCVGPRYFEPALPTLAAASDRRSALAPLVDSLRRRLHERRPELIAISTASTRMPDGLTPASLFLQDYPIFEPGGYVPLSSGAVARVHARGWTLLRRQDVSERLP